jgi:class 3 adenylate cyclase
MALKDEIEAEVKKILREQWATRDGNVVPESENLTLGNDAVKLSGTVLYADLSGSTKMVDSETPSFAAEVYKAYLYSAARVIRSEGGTITAYDGDRVMAVFIGDSKNTSAARCGLKLNYIVKHIINPSIKSQYTSKSFVLQQVVGIDTSSLFVTRTGVRGANDLVWVGRAANHAAKLTELSADSPTWISGDVYDNMNDSVKRTNSNPMWQQRSWTPMGGKTIYCSTWWWRI